MPAHNRRLSTPSTQSHLRLGDSRIGSTPQTSGPTLPDPAAVKTLVLEAIGSDPLLSQRLIFKGGSAIEILFGISARASIDLDFSLEGDFDPRELADIRTRIAAALQRVFSRIHLRVFDLSLTPRPTQVSPDLAAFWGGYRIQFKLAIDSIAIRFENDIENLRRNAIAVGPSQRKSFEIDISRHELCPGAERHTIGGATILAYSPRLIVAEKLRAICQQHSEYRSIVRSPGGHPRSRDFFDIVTIIEAFTLILATPDFLLLLKQVFTAKRVPIDLLWRIDEAREFHRADFHAVQDTVRPGTELLTFDEYFDKVLTLAGRLQTLGSK